MEGIKRIGKVKGKSVKENKDIVETAASRGETNGLSNPFRAFIPLEQPCTGMIVCCTKGLQPPEVYFYELLCLGDKYWPIL